MSIQPDAGTIPAWTLGDRLRKARETAGLSQAELAADIGISRASVVNYEVDRYTPSRPVLLSWALRTGVPLTWLAGAAAPGGPGWRVSTHMSTTPLLSLVRPDLQRRAA
jgi:DNA-binding XRE family transcriptional regulator